MPWHFRLRWQARLRHRASLPALSAPSEAKFDDVGLAADFVLAGHAARSAVYVGLDPRSAEC